MYEWQLVLRTSLNHKLIWIPTDFFNASVQLWKRSVRGRAELAQSHRGRVTAEMVPGLCQQHLLESLETKEEREEGGRSWLLWQVIFFFFRDTEIKIDKAILLCQVKSIFFLEDTALMFFENWDMGEGDSWKCWPTGRLCRTGTSLAHRRPVQNWELAAAFGWHKRNGPIPDDSCMPEHCKGCTVPIQLLLFSPDVWSDIFVHICSHFGGYKMVQKKAVDKAYPGAFEAISHRSDLHLWRERAKGSLAAVSASAGGRRPILPAVCWNCHVESYFLTKLGMVIVVAFFFEWSVDVEWCLQFYSLGVVSIMNFRTRTLFIACPNCQR